MNLVLAILERNIKNVAGPKLMSANVWGNEKTEYFNSVTPDQVLNAIESLGYKATGRVMQLASMENRVFEVEIENEDAKHVSEKFKILKFYRPGRWSKEQIQEEHQFLFDLIEHDIHAIAPEKSNQESVFITQDGLYFCIFPKQGGRACDEWNDELLAQMGRLLARLHNVGKAHTAKYRLKLDINTFGEKNLELILKSPHMLPEYQEAYKLTAQTIFKLSHPLFEQIQFQRIHGDCHHGNILLHDGRPFLIDFDDMSVGPRVQDIWMITPGRDEYSLAQREKLLAAYTSMSDFDYRELKVIESLRALRMIHFSAWIGHRFQDQAFQRAFPTFGSHQYWEKEIFELKTQIGYIQDELTALY
ncbi:MAG: serine/threonine protein kinase [Halobacteriovoraceae bacterium]|jgi:Ser/Thr protein kinase RdoA (MazF antagonist)|nr:serine/threonine protein kinase [Halobacteriovoraceae bacterium]